MPTVWKWAIFAFAILGLLALDLGRNRKATSISMRSAIVWSLLWIGTALGFSLGIAHFDGSQTAMQFLAGYLLEKALSVDNLFVFLVIFRYFRVAPAQQHRVLFWGVLGAILMRAIFILIGVELLNAFSVLFYVFGGILLYTAYKMIGHEELDVQPEHSWTAKVIRRFLPFTDQTDGDRFFIVRDARRLATPLFMVLLLVEVTDLLFAVDSIPAVLSISKSYFIVFTSNVFAILGLRSMYFVLAGLLDRFRFLDYGLAVILTFTGLEMLFQTKPGLTESFNVDIPIGITLAVIAGILFLTCLFSWLFPDKLPLPDDEPEEAPMATAPVSPAPPTSPTPSSPPPAEPAEGSPR